MKKIFVLLAMGFISCTAIADSKPSDASLEELLSITEAHKIVDNMLPQMETMIITSARQSLAGKTPDAEQRDLIEKVVAKTTALVRQEITYQQMKPLFMKSYRDNFTQEEITEFLKFYKTKAGQAYLKKMPAVTQAANIDMQIKLTSLLPRIQKFSEEALADSQEKRKTAPDE